MNKLILLLCLLLCSGCGNAQQKSTSFSAVEKTPLMINADTVITKHYYSFGSLYDREYELTIKGTGEVTFIGKTSLRDDTGVKEQWTMSQDDLARLVEGFQNIGFFQLSNEYGNLDGTHTPWTTIKIATNDKEKTIKRWFIDEKKFTHEEHSLRNLELLINRTVGADSRIRKAFDLSLEYYPTDENIP